MKTFEISVKDKIAALTNREMYVCGNSDFVVDFSFDAEWDAYDTKTARFAYKGTYQDQVFQGTQCPVPIIHDTQIIMVGVFAGNLHTTTAACISARRSILSGSGVPADPAPDVYVQIMELIQGLGDPDPETIAAAVADYIRQNPIEESDPTVPAWAKEQEKPTYTAYEVGAISQDDLQAATDTALSQAKESGLFDGQPGKDGVDGKDGQPGADGRDGLPGVDGADGVGIQSVEQTTTSTEDGGTNVITVTKTDGTSSTFSVKNGSRGQDATVDATLTQSGKAADAAVVGQRLGELSEEKVALPKDTDGNPIPGTAGWYAVSDGAGGITWVESAPSTGGGGETTTYGIVWDLTNVTSSNNAVSVSYGASLTAVLTAADGYTLGDVTVTMGGEALTGVWNADTATVTIASVTGDVVISCAGVEIPSIVDTTAKIAGTGYGLNAHGELQPLKKACYTEFYSFGRTIEGSDYRKIIYYVSTGNQSGMAIADKQQVYQDGDFVTYWTTKFDSVNENKFTGNYGPFNQLRFSLVTAYIDDDYAYFADTGDVIFAGKNTPYYGMANIDGTMAGGGSTPETASVMSVDDDYAMDYGISTLSLVTNESASVAADTGLDAAYAAVIEEAKNAWMVEANGNVDKIPLIIHTDQHGNFSKPLWDTIDKMVDWYEISKVVNLGDTVGHWVDADTDHPLTKNADLETYLESMESVPYSKRIEVFGNHDTWKLENGAYSGLNPQNYLRKYFKNIYARGKDNYGNMVVYDDRYNVKYLIISGMAYDSEIGGYSHYIIPSGSWDWIIDQLEKADGYDVVVLSHVALGRNGETVINPTGETAEESVGCVDWVARTDFWAARKNKTSGSFTDQYGVAHAYDFTSCDGELLCGLHGHEHADGYYYLGDSLLDVFFDAYYISPRAIHFVLIDRANSQLNVWKVDDTPQVQNYQIPLEKPTE